MPDPQTKLVNIRRTKKYDVYIGRAGKNLDGYFGNPISLESCGGDREYCIRAYTLYFIDRVVTDHVFHAKVEALRGKTLGCFCHPAACHGEVIIHYLDHGAMATAKHFLTQSQG